MRAKSIEIQLRLNSPPTLQNFQGSSCLPVTYCDTDINGPCELSAAYQFLASCTFIPPSHNEVSHVWQDTSEKALAGSIGSIVSIHCVANQTSVS